MAWGNHEAAHRYFLASIKGACLGPLPDRMEPQLTTAVDRPPEDDAWRHELKFDCCRLIALRAGQWRLRAGAGFGGRVFFLHFGVFANPQDNASFINELAPGYGSRLLARCAYGSMLDALSFSFGRPLG